MLHRNSLFLLAVLLIVPLLIAGVMLGGFLTSTVTLENSGANVLHYNSLVCPEVMRADGTVEKFPCSKNFFTPTGKNMVMDLLGYGGNPPGGGAKSNVTQIAICNVTNGGCSQCSILNCNSTDTGFANKTGTVLTNVAGVSGNWSISATFTATTDGNTFNGTGLLNGSSTGAGFFANNTFTAVTLNTNDAITIRWNVSIS